MKKISKKIVNGIMIFIISMVCLTLLYISPFTIFNQTSEAKSNYDNYYMISLNSDGEIMHNIYFKNIDKITVSNIYDRLCIVDKVKGTWEHCGSPYILIPENIDIAINNSGFNYTTIAEWYRKTDKNIVIVSTTNGIPVYLFIGDDISITKNTKDLFNRIGYITIDDNIIYYYNLAVDIIYR